MHPTALDNADQLFNCHIGQAAGKTALDVGAQNIDVSLNLGEDNIVRFDD